MLASFLDMEPGELLRTLVELSHEVVEAEDPTRLVVANWPSAWRREHQPHRCGELFLLVATKAPLLAQTMLDSAGSTRRPGRLSAYRIRSELERALDRRDFARASVIEFGAVTLGLLWGSKASGVLTELTGCDGLSEFLERGISRAALEVASSARPRGLDGIEGSACQN